MVPLVAIVRVMMVVGGITKRTSLVALGKPDDERSSSRLYPTSAGRVENLGAVGTFKSSHGGHGLGGGGQGGGCGSGKGRATCFAGALLPGAVWSGTIKNLSWPSSRRQTAPLLAKVKIGGFYPGDR